MCVVAYFLAFSEQANEYKNILGKLYVNHMCGWRVCIILFAYVFLFFWFIKSRGKSKQAENRVDRYEFIEEF